MTRAATPGVRVGRDGALRLRFQRCGARTVLRAWRSTLPLQVLAPVALADPACVVSVLNPTGGLVGGDRLSIDVTVEPGAHALATTPSATKVYRTDGPLAEQVVRLDVGADAVLEWLPDHMIPFPGSALRQTMEVRLARGARVVLVDAFAAGRVARGETWQFAALESAVEVADPAGRLFLDRFALRGGAGAISRCGGLGGTEGHGYFATIVVVAPGDLAGYVRAAMVSTDDTIVGGSPLPRGGAVVRILGRSAPGFLAAVEHAWTEARTRLLGFAPLDLRK